MRMYDYIIINLLELFSFDSLNWIKLHIWYIWRSLKKKLFIIVRASFLFLLLAKSYSMSFSCTHISIWISIFLSSKAYSIIYSAIYLIRVVSVKLFCRRDFAFRPSPYQNRRHSQYFFTQPQAAAMADEEKKITLHLKVTNGCEDFITKKFILFT